MPYFIVWPDTAVTHNALEQCLAEIRKALGDDSRDPRFFKTVQRTGYRLIGEVEEICAAPKVTTSVSRSEDGPCSVSAEAPRADYWIRKRAVVLSIGIILVAVAATAIYLIQRHRSVSQLSKLTLPQTAGKRSVAVMFFDNQSGNADLDSLRERLADMLITDLSHSTKTILSRQQLHTPLDHSNYPLVHYHLARALELKGSQDQARVEYERFLEVWKQADTDVVQAKRVLTGK